MGFQSLYPGLSPLGRCRVGPQPQQQPGGTGPGATPTRGLLRCPGALDVVVVVVVVVVVIVVIAIIVIVIMIIMSIMVVILIIVTIAIIIIIMIITMVITIIMIRIIVIIVMIITRPGRCLKRQVSGSTVSSYITA